MRYRRLAADGDFVMGHGGADYLVDVPEAPAQAVVTRLRLLAEEWFLDLAEGTPYVGGVVGKQTLESYDPVIRARILGTDGVTEILFYESSLDPDTRKLTVNARIDTVYGEARIQEAL